MRTVGNIQAVRRERASLSGRVGIVPTMGALHDGHLSLVERAQSENDAVIVSIFVNPTQFARHEDLDAYPRDLPGDLAKLEQVGVNLVFTPPPDTMYPPGHQTVIDVTGVSQGLEGERRPGHFRGVATVVAKLFNITLPDAAYFGQKDAQQAAVIRRMAEDLNFPVDIVVCPTLREPDGLAMSSRNVYLNPRERAAAPVVYHALKAAEDVFANGEHSPAVLRQRMLDVLAGEPLGEVEYASVADAVTLTELEQPINTDVLLSLAVRFGRTRLIDNLSLHFSGPT